MGLHLDPHEFCVDIRWWLELDISRDFPVLFVLGHYAAHVRRVDLWSHDIIGSVISVTRHILVFVQVEVGSTLTPDGSRSCPAYVLVCYWIAG